MDPHHPHDALFKIAFREPEDAAGLLRSALPAWVAAAIDWSTLRRLDVTMIDPPLRGKRSDLLFSALLGGEEVLLYVVTEHKSGEDPLTPFQMLLYVVRVLEQHWHREGRPRSLPPVLPFVFHHGLRPWRGPRDVRHLVRLGNLPPDVARFVRRHQVGLLFLLDDVTAQSEEQIQDRLLSIVGLLSVLFLKRLRQSRLSDLQGHITRWRNLVTRLLDHPRGREILAALYFYMLATTKAAPEQMHAVVHELLEPRTATTMTNALERVLQKAKEEGQADLLLRQLQRRFGALPEATVAQVRKASVEDFERWSDAVLTASTLAEVFATRS